jgi:hypothetical protein
MGGPTSSYAAAGIALEFIGAHKPLTQQQSAFDKVDTIEWALHSSINIICSLFNDAFFSSSAYLA